ncbi:AraC family transcriptional regulator [Paenibacillus sp. PAMC21692]|uniref:AraC family transcriptional regulator n=1 Tax=Paenibacillus sp. PAMC21692 TaxID=2762320 RepID=UPI0021C49E29|nr:AraC family transcriptional regulator [Paenibacillus sp. PAMC21692]
MPDSALPRPISLDHVQSVTAGSIVYPPGGRFGPRIQQDIQLVLLHSGEMRVSIEGQMMQVQPGHVVKLMPGYEERFAFAEDEETWHRWIAVHVEELPEETLTLMAELPVVLPLSEELNHLTDLLLSVQHRTYPGDPLLRTLGLAALQLYPLESKRVTERENHSSVYTAISWMKEHLMEEISLTDLASKAGVSSEHLVRLFRHYENDTPIHYLWKLRVNKAIDLLVHTGLTVTEIAERCGYQTTHHLARQMKQMTGLTATQVRRNSWKGLGTNRIRS